MNLKLKGIIMSVAVAGMILGTGAVATSANTITKSGIKTAMSGLSHYDTFSWTGTSGGYAYAQVWAKSVNLGTNDYELAGAVGYNSWAQTPQKQFNIKLHTVEGRHWSDSEYKVSKA